MMVVAILATLATIGMTNFISYRKRTKLAVCITDLKNIERTILVYTLDNNRLPSSSQQAGVGTLNSCPLFNPNNSRRHLPDLVFFTHRPVWRHALENLAR